MVDKPTLTSPPPAPNRNQPGNDFAGKADAWVLWQQDEHVPEVQQAVDYIEQEADIAEAASDSASVAAGVAGATEWISGASYTAGDPVWSPADKGTYRARTTHSGVTTDPSEDTTNWAGVTVQNLQRSTHDTAGTRALVQGAYGGAGGLQLDLVEARTPNDTADDFDIPAGFWVTSTTTTGLPDLVNVWDAFSSTQFGVLGVWYSGANCFQEWTPNFNDDLTFRRRSTGLSSSPTWGDWYVVHNSATLNGTVAGGLSRPTGALAEYGANSNGEYFRQWNRWQMCFFTADGTGVSGTWTFPAAFTAIYYVDCTCFGPSTPAKIHVGLEQPSLAAVDWELFNVNDGSTTAAGARDKTFTAFGVW